MEGLYIPSCACGCVQPPLARCPCPQAAQAAQAAQAVPQQQQAAQAAQAAPQAAQEQAAPRLVITREKAQISVPAKPKPLPSLPVDSTYKCTAVKDKLHVIVPMNNYMRFTRRYEVLLKTIEQLAANPHVLVYLVETSLGDRPFMVTSRDNPRHLQLRTPAVLWHKENQINLAVQRLLPAEWQYMAWIDGDVQFMNKHWAEDTIHEMQRCGVVQMFQSVMNMGPDGEILSTYESFMYKYMKNGFKLPHTLHQSGGVFHPGFAWAMRRDVYDAVGGLLDFPILGSADAHMACAFVGKVELSAPRNLHPNYTTLLKQYQRLSEKHLGRAVGYVKGTLQHQWHGTFTNRRYRERWGILSTHQYDPLVDIVRDSTGIYRLSDNTGKWRMREEIAAYFRERNEDQNTKES